MSACCYERQTKVCAKLLDEMGNQSSVIGVNEQCSCCLASSPVKLSGIEGGVERETAKDRANVSGFASNLGFQ